MNAPAWRRQLVPVGVIVAVGVLTFLPFAAGMGFYRDDWYMLWSAHARGPESIIELFSIDRPFMGYTYSLTYRLLGDSAIAWQLYATGLKIVGALAVYGIMRLLWPGGRAAGLAAALLFLIYPGFLGQPNAGTKTNQLLSLTAVLVSIVLSGWAVRATRPGWRLVLTAGALLLGLLNFLLYEYMIGLEVLRLGVLWVVPQQARPVQGGARVRRLLRDWLPYALAAAGFLVWRLVIFKSDRGGTDQFSVAQGILQNPRSALVNLAIESVMDILESVVLAWTIPLQQLASNERPWRIAVAFGLGIAVTAGCLTALWLQGRYADEAGTDEPGRPAVRDVMLVGAVSLYAALLPVLLAGRDIRFSGGFDKYTLHASPAVAILLAGFLFGMVRRWGLPVLLGLCLFLGTATHILNGYQWQRVWNQEKDLWWQLWWRAPDLQDGTVLLASIPEGGFFEDYELWGPANLIYRPASATVTLGAEVVNPSTVWKVRTGLDETRFMRKLSYERDFSKTLVLYLPNDNSCLRVINPDAPLLPLDIESRLHPVLAFSEVDQIQLATRASVPPGSIFGDEPVHDWCFYYQSGELARQGRDWEGVEKLGDEARAARLKPIYLAEWLPFLEAYVRVGRTDDARELAVKIASDGVLRHEICDALARQETQIESEVKAGMSDLLCVY